jgi:hypothetical protein
MKLYIAGMGLIGVVIGLLTGASSSPVVAVILPLLFTLMTAGGNFYVVWGERQREADAPSRDRSARAKFLGGQLTVFAVGFLVGVWSGILAKLRPDLLWPVQVGRPAYAAMTPSPTFASLPVYRHLDNVLVSDGVPYAKRLELLHAMQIPAEVLSQTVSRVSSSRVLDIPALEIPAPAVSPPAVLAGGGSNVLPRPPSPKLPDIIARWDDIEFKNHFVCGDSAMWTNSTLETMRNRRELFDLSPATNRSRFGPAALPIW